MDDQKKAKHAENMRLWRKNNPEHAREISRAGNKRYFAKDPEHVRAKRTAAAQRRRAAIKSDPVAHRAYLNELARQRYAAKVKADPTYIKRKALHGRKWREENPELAKQAAREATRKWRAANPEKVREQNLRYKEKKESQQLRKRQDIRAALLSFFGGVCCKCGFSDPRALHLDHIHGDGNKERKAGKGNKWDQYRLIQSDPNAARARYQLLCANCNMIKQYERGEYRKIEKK